MSRIIVVQIKTTGINSHQEKKNLTYCLDACCIKVLFMNNEHIYRSLNQIIEVIFFLLERKIIVVANMIIVINR